MGRDYRKFKIYHLSYAFLMRIYKEVLPTLPESEARNIFSQLQRASTSIVLNIVEGCSNVSNKVFFNHLQYSYGSARETDVLLQLCLDLNYIGKDTYASLVNDLEELKATTYQFMKRVDTEVLQKTDNYTFW